MASISSRIHNDDIIYPSAAGFVLVHLACEATGRTGVADTRDTAGPEFWQRQTSAT